MEMHKVESSTIKKIGYNRELRELRVEFNSGITYSYRDLPAEIYEKLMKADSVGKYFAKYIKHNYLFKKEA